MISSVNRFNTSIKILDISSGEVFSASVVNPEISAKNIVTRFLCPPGLISEGLFRRYFATCLSMYWSSVFSVSSLFFPSVA